jgi:cyclic beta-1,2-glucan synthetase
LAVTVLGYFANRDEAGRAARQLQRKDLSRSVLLHKAHDGTIHTWDPFGRRRAGWMLAAAVLGAGLAGSVGGILSAAPGPSLIAGALIGAIGAGIQVRRSRYGVPRALLHDHARWLVPDETVLVLKAPREMLSIAADALREGGEIPPIVFFQYPPSAPETVAEKPATVPLSLAQIEAHARRLAEDHAAPGAGKGAGGKGAIQLRPYLRPSRLREPGLLDRVRQARRAIHEVSADLAVANRLEQGTPPLAEWILDNEYVVEANARDIRLNLPRRYYQELPALPDGLPRIYRLAQELVSHTDHRLDRENILSLVETYQAIHSLTIGELWAYPQMLRVALIESIHGLAVKALVGLRERQQADFWANRLMTVSRRDPNQLFAIMAELSDALPSPSPYFASQLIDHLYDEEAALAPVRGWLELIYRRPLGELNLREQNRQTREQISIRNAFTSLRQLALLDWRGIFEALSHVERALRSDPAGVYPAMDFETRDSYRRAIEGIARGAGLPEPEVARRAVAEAGGIGQLAGGIGQLAGGASQKTDSNGDERAHHVGTYLVGRHRRQFARGLGSRESLRTRLLQTVYAVPSLFYFTAAAATSLALLAILARFGDRGLPTGAWLAVVLLSLIPISQLSLNLVDYLVTRLLPPRGLPKMDFEASGIPSAFRTLVLVPELLVDPPQIRAEVEKLEIRYLANRESNLLFALFTDYRDSDTAHREEDERLLQEARGGIASLNQTYGGDRFFLFHRERAWSESEQKFIGRERKRGKLEEFNRLIAGGIGQEPVRAPWGLDGTLPESSASWPEAAKFVAVGDAEMLSDVRFVITLDSDTQLPSGSARRMVETLAHPLNQPRFDSQGRIEPGTYTIIQPRVSPTLPSTSATPFARLFSDAVGIDPYTKAVSDVNQDLRGEASYHGKAIYDVRAFSRVLSGRFPEGRLLSHDLIEGAHVGVGLASDIELLDEFPPDYLSYTSRQHRWIRGDWQIAEWTLPRVPRAAAGRAPNQISAFNRWKILDNLRRSLVPLANVGLLLASWLISPHLGWIAAAVVGLQLLFPPLALPFTWVTSLKGLRNFSLAKLAHDWARALAEAALLPHQAGLALDAIVRANFRLIISHRKLLEWTSAQTIRHRAALGTSGFARTMALASVFSLAAAWAVRVWQPASFPAAAPWLGLWLVSPGLGWLLNLRPQPKPLLERLGDRDLRFLRHIARKTWRFFSDFVGEATSWLPPDNYQVSHQDQLALRTSPTNIGMWMLSALAARDFGYITLDQVVEKLTHTMAAIGKLERYEGHLLNWYDIQTLAPLEPRYVSAVDSGNLVGALWSLKQGLEEMIYTPLFDGRGLEGLRDTWDVLSRTDGQPGDSGLDPRSQAALGRALEAPSAGVVADVRFLRSISERLSATASMPKADVETQGRYWSGEMARQVTAWIGLADRYLAWVDILAEKSADDLAPLGDEAVEAVRRDLRQAPSLHDLAGGQGTSLTILGSIRSPDPALVGWLDRVAEAHSKSKWLAGEMLAMAERLIQDVTELADSINLRFLYDSQRRLFAVGYNVTAGLQDSAYYDLLASEARLGSFVAIAGGSVPIDHWFSMSRPYNAIGRRRVLLSWSGTMFEYVMPLLFQRSYGNSLLDRAVKDAVATQVDYGRRRRVPWGFSECAYGDLDVAKTYQYKAFGVPELGLKRDIEQEVVIAPYATLLALPVAPRRSTANLRRLAELGLMNDFGYYEAMDFSRRPRRKGERGVIVRAYMAHHQGMALLSLANFLHGNSFRRRFHADPRVRAVESLLQERVPTLAPLHYISTRERMPSVEGVSEGEPSVSKFDTPHTPTPKTQLLSNGRYSLMVTNAGGGYSKWGDFELTRWRSDRTQDAWGTFCYLREPEPGHVWSNTFHPVGGKVENYSVDFALDRAVIRRADHGIHTETEIAVSPEDDVEIRRITLINRGIATRHIELTSYLELSLAPHNADVQHPAFQKLFVQTEAVPAHQALLAFRRSRHTEDPPIFVGHRLTTEADGTEERLRFETDRRRFIGRGRTLRDPMGIGGEPGGIGQLAGQSQGFVLDPIFSLRRGVTLGPGERVQVSLILAAGDTREKVLQLMAKFGDPRAVERAMDFAWASAQLELRLLRIHPDNARRFQKLAGQMLYPTSFLRPSADRVEERNRKGQAGLWAYGISGDLPIALVTIGESRDTALVRQMLQAHTYWRTHGFMADLVILNEEASGYDQPLHEQLEALIRAHSMYTGVDKPGGVFLRSADQVTAEDRTLFAAASSIALVAARGTLGQQLGVPVEVPDVPRPIARKRLPREPSAPLPFMELPYFNSLGGFTPDGREYAIYLGPDTHTPAPWVNVIANPSFGTLVSETGAGFTWYGNSQRNRLTPWSDDPVLDPPSEAIYVRDEETGEVWTPTAAPIRETSAYRVRHGAGRSVFEHNSHAIEQELTVLVPVDTGGGKPVKLQRLRLKNDSGRRRVLSLTYYVEWSLGESREASQMHVVSQWDEDALAILARNHFHPEYGGRIAFAALNLTPSSYTADRTTFLGRNRSAANPLALERAELSRAVGAGLDPCAALQVGVELAPGETAEVICMLGEGETTDEVHELIQAHREGVAFQSALDATEAWWDEVLGGVEVHTPELAADFLINRWMLYQTLSCRMWGRSGFYQSGGAFGFRDQLQDAMALVYSAPDLAREHILRAAGRQFPQGDVQHWWHPPTGAGIRSRISDDALWLPHVVAHYVRITGDAPILDVAVPFLDAPSLGDDERDVFQTPGTSQERASLFEHCQRALAHGLTAGTHGLPLIGTGDWNDGMDRVGAAGVGESVWLAWFLVDVLAGMADLAEKIGQSEAAQSYRAKREALRNQIERVAWDGEWYLRAWFDDGTPLGTAAGSEARIDSLPQSWAWLSGGADRERAEQALQSAWDLLVKEEDGLVLLFDPPFDQSDPSPGYIRGYPPGVRENGGQYTHAAVWLAMALARRGDGTRAAQILRMINPVERARESEGAWRYGLEPYVIGADIYYAPGHVGQGGWSWYTGSAAWMYRAWLEEVLGFHRQGDTLRIDPVIPGWWEGFHLKYRHGEAVYEIQVENPDRVEHGVASLELDGQIVKDGAIALERDLVKHRVRVRMGRAEESL